MKKYIELIRKELIVLLLTILTGFSVYSQTAGDYRTRADGNWSNRNTWQRYNGLWWANPTVGEGYPGQYASPGNVLIDERDDVTLDVSPANSIGSLSVDVTNGNRQARLYFQGTNALVVTGQTVLRSTRNNTVKAIYVDAGTFTTGSLSLTGTGDTRDALVSISSGTVNVIGDINLNSSNQRSYILFTGDGTLNVGGDMSGGGITNTTGGGANPPTSGTVDYNGAAAQSVGAYTYYNLTFSGGGAKTVAGAITINGDFTSSEQINATANITANGTFSSSGQINTNSNISLNGAVPCSGGTMNATNGLVTYNTAATNIITGTYNNLTKSGGGTSTLCGDVTVSNILNLNTGIIRLSNHNLSVTNTAAGAITGTFSATNMIETDGDGILTKQGTDAGLSIVYPVGSAGYYTPMDLSNGIIASYSGTGSVSVRAVSGSQGTAILSKYWEVSTSNITSITDVYPLFTYNMAEADASQASYIPWYNPGAGWQNPPNSTGAGVNPFGSTSTTSLAGDWTSGVSAPTVPETYYSYQTGNWNAASTWTHDPGGTTQTATDFPNAGDRVVILDGRTITLTSNLDTTGLDINIKEGGILDLSTYQFNNDIATLRGQGTFKLASVNYPTVNTNLFILAGGGTTEYYNAADFTLPVAQTEYNHLHINAPGVVATQLNNIILNGDLCVKQGTYRINDNTANRRQLTINGDVLVDNGASITIGTGNTQSGDISGATTASPFIDYYDLNSHRVVVYGDFTNNGTVKLTNQSYPEYDAFPTNGMATIYFMGATNNDFYCGGTTDLYNLVLDKGIDQTYKLSVYSTAYDHFRLFGRNNLGGENGGNNPDLRKALWIRTGTLELKGLTIIPSFSEANSGGSPNGDFYIPANAALYLNGSEVIVLSTADDYREVNLAYNVSATSNGDMGILASGGTQSFSIYGKFQIDNGYFSTRESGGIITWDVSSGELEINGGIVDVKQYRSAGGSGGLASFSQSGGTFILRGRFQRTPAAYASIDNLKDFSTTTLNTTRVTAGLNGSLGTFNINETENVFAMSGGTISIYDVCGTTENEAFQVLTDIANNNVTGGTIEFIPTAGASGTDATEFIVETTADLGNMIVNRTSSSASVNIDTYDLTILYDLTITAGELDANNFDISIGGNFTIENGTTYTPGTNMTIFNGTGDQTLEVNAAGTLALKKLKIDNPVGSTVTLAGTQSTITVEDSLLIINGNLADGGKTLELVSSTTTTTSYIYNSGIHTGTGSITISDDDPTVITGDGTGVFENIELNNTDALTAPVSLGANTTINGTLTFSQDKLFDISTYELIFGVDATVANEGTSRFIQTAGSAGDGGVSKIYSLTSTSFTFAVGTSSTSHPAAEYTPATLTFGTNPTTFGTITVVPVGYEHPNTTNKNRSLTYFWRTKSEGFTLDAATINHSYTYSQNDVVTGGDVTENQYIGAMYNSAGYTWTKYSVSDVDDGTNIIGGTGTALATLNYIDGEFTAGDDDATDPFGTPTKYYSRGNGDWDSRFTWSNTGHGGGAAATTPGANDIVIIGNGNTVDLTQNENCASLEIIAGSVLDIDLYTGSNFARVLSNAGGNGLFRLKTTNAGAGNRIQLFTFPSGDFTDFNSNGGTTEFYTTTSNGSNVYILPANVKSYGNLILSPNGLDNLSLPNNSYTNIYGDLTLNSSTYNSWTTMSWNTTNWGSGAYNPTIEKTVHVHGSFYVSGGSFVFMNDYEPQHLIVEDNIEINSADGANIFILDPDVRGTWVGGTPQDNTLQVGGDIVNNSNTGVWYQPGLLLNSGDYYCDVTFFGSGTHYLTNTGGAPETHFRKVTINKGTSQADSLIVDIGGTLSTPTDDWLTLQNGTFHYEHNDDLTITEGSQFTIPSTACLSVNTSGNTVYLANDNVDDNDVYLNGKLTIIDGDVYIGQVGAPNNNNDIEYSGGGNSEIDIQGGSLTVNGQIRRNPSTSAGVLKYNQSGGTVAINGRNTLTDNAKLEILNAGSEFNMSGGTLTIVRGGGGGTFGDLYLRPGSSTVTGGEIIFNPGAAGAQDFIFDANVPVWDLTIEANANVELLVSPLEVDGDLTLTTATTSILDANINFDIPITIKGDFDNSGVYTHRNNVTIFDGGTQTILGSAAIDFYNLTVNSLTKLTLNRDANVDNDLLLSRGTLECDINTVYVQGDVTNNATYTDTNSGIVLNGTTEQLIDGTGTWGQLELDNAQGARVENDLTLQDDLILTSGVFDINDELLTLGAASDILGAPFDETNMIASDGVFSNVGIKKIFSDTDDGTTYTFPLGTSGKYTPTVLTITQIGTTGSFRINNINDNHPGVLDNTNVLDYYWEAESDGITGFTGSLVLNYLDEDVQVTGANVEADYISAALLLPGTSWSKTDAVDDAANTITFNYSNVSSLDGEYTAGIDAALPNQVPEFSSNVDNGNWSTPASWIQTAGDAYTLTGGPNGFIVNVLAEDTITTDANYASTYRLSIEGVLKVDKTTYGHNLGTVSGSGTLYLESGTFPAGRFASFLDCSSNSTLEYGGNTNYNIVADLYSSIPNIHFTGTGTRTLPNKDLTICTQLLIDGPTLDNSVNNRKLTIQGTMERYNTGVFTSGSGAGAIVSFEGSAAQTIGGALGDFTGTSDFNYLEINNSAGLTINNGGDIEVSGNLLLTDGNITTSSTNTLTITNTAINCVTPIGGSSSSYVDGPLTKKINQGDNFVFPIGKGAVVGNKIELSSTQTGTIDWTVEFSTPNSTYTSMTAPLTYVNADEYWTVSAASGSEAIVGIDWDPTSDLTPLMTQNGLTDMRVAYDNAGTWTEIASTATGNSSNGTVSTSSRITIPAGGSTDFTSACVNVTKPRARLNPSGAVCGAEGIPVVFTGSGLAYDYMITYEKGGVLQAPVTINSGDVPYTLPTDAIGTTYQLISFTYDEPGNSTTGVVDASIVTTFTVPTTADIGSDGGLDDDDISDCGATSVPNLPGNNPVTGVGLWTILSGTGGSFVSPTVYNTTFNGTNGTTYELEWSITNGGCVSSDTMVVAFPLLPVQPGAFTVYDADVCQGQTGVIYTVPNDPTASSYTWTYSGTNASGYATDTDNSVTIDFASNATGGTLSVYITNGCGDSPTRDLAITVHPIPTANDQTPADMCSETAGDVVTVTGLDLTSHENAITGGSGDAVVWYSDAGLATLVPDPTDVDISDTFGGTTSITKIYYCEVDNGNCTNVATVTYTIYRIPETGPQYHIENAWGN